MAGLFGMGMGTDTRKKKPTPFASSLDAVPGTGAAPMGAGGTANTTPLAPTSQYGNPISGAPLGPLPHSGAQGMGSRRIEQRTAQGLYGNFRRANPYLWSSILNLQGQANQNRMSDPLRSSFLAPRQQAINTSFQQGQNALDRGLTERGLGDSGAMASGLGALEGARSGAQSQMTSDLYQTEDERQRQAQQQLLAALFGISNQGAQGAGIAGNIRGQDLQQAQFDQSKQFDWGGLLQGILGAAGSAYGAGAFGGGGSLGSLFGGGSGDMMQNPAIYKKGWSGYL